MGKANTVMNECERHLAIIRVEEIGDDWEDRIIRFLFNISTFDHLHSFVLCGKLLHWVKVEPIWCGYILCISLCILS